MIGRSKNVGGALKKTKLFEKLVGGDLENVAPAIFIRSTHTHTHTL